MFNAIYQKVQEKVAAQSFLRQALFRFALFSKQQRARAGIYTVTTLVLFALTIINPDLLALALGSSCVS